LDDLAAIERFTGLYDRYRNRVYAYAVSRSGRQLADEVVSEVFLVAWRRLDELPSDPLPWLLVTARNVIGTEFRAAARQESLAAELASWGSGVAADIADEVSERHAVLRALAALPEADRELLTLSAWHGLTPREAASVIGCSPATYFVRLHRARRRLEKAMADRPESEHRQEMAVQQERRPRWT
jgi:RNA polymerase sigma-70 factor, ECF subfamily